MLPRIATAALLLATLFVAACSSNKTAPLPTAAETDQAVKARVDQFIATAQAQPKSAPNDLAMMLEYLDARAADDASRYGAVRDAAKELQAKYQSGAGQAEIDQQIDALRQATAALGG